MDNGREDQFRLPVGTHVVPRVDRGGVPAGTVGTVEGGPGAGGGPYAVVFASGERAEYAASELVVQRRQVRDDLGRMRPGFAELEPYVVYEVTVGSRAYGLDREGSDEDVRGVYLPPAELHWSLAGVPEQIEDPAADRVYWEIEKFVRLALQANPNILETLWTPAVGRAAPVGERLRAERSIFLSKHAYATYGAYALSQFKKMERDLRTRGEVRFKHAMHCIRLLVAGVRLLERGEVMVDCSEYRERLLAVRDGELSWEEIGAWRRELEGRMAAAYSRTQLPERPDYARADRLLVDARRSQA
jgi:predicted nucleotidyltransferase